VVGFNLGYKSFKLSTSPIVGLRKWKLSLSFPLYRVSVITNLLKAVSKFLVFSESVFKSNERGGVLVKDVLVRALAVFQFVNALKKFLVNLLSKVEVLIFGLNIYLSAILRIVSRRHLIVILLKV